MSLWFKDVTLDEINKMSENTMVSALDIQISEITDSTLSGVMPVTDNIKQPFGIVHGGANCVLAETLGSIAANLTVNPTQMHAVGLSINTSHIKAVRNGKVHGTAINVHKGRTTQIWEIKTYNDAKELTSTSTLTMAIVSRLNK